MQTAQLRYSPFHGRCLLPGFFALDAREAQPGRPWQFDPWSGRERTQKEIDADPEGVTIEPPGDPAPKFDAAALRRLALDLLDPERHAHAVTPEIRNQARRALGIGIDTLE